jgi:hypothetical protein
MSQGEVLDWDALPWIPVFLSPGDWLFGMNGTASSADHQPQAELKVRSAWF